MRRGLSVEEAQEVVLAATPLLGQETVAVRDAHGRVLAEDILCERRIPPADNSAMDGYAVRRADLQGASMERPGELAVAFEVAAGAHPDRELGPGEAARIFTGAPIPPGADAVVRQEDTERAGPRVRVQVEPEPREHIRDAGEEMVPGDLAIEAGRRVRSAEIGVLASLGRGVVSVHQRPRVALLSGGDELVEPDRDVAGGRIVSSNSYTLAAQCREVGAEPIYLGIARDDPADIEERLRAGLRADCIVSSAGVSVGDRDYVRDVLERLGCRLVFWGVNMKPGYPLAFGHFGPEDAKPGTPPLVFGLPGNPVSASVTFLQFVRPALRRMQGHARWFAPTVQATLEHSLEKKAGRLHFVRVVLEDRDGERFATSTGNQSSGVLRSLSIAQGLLVFPADATTLAKGDRVTVQITDDDYIQAADRGF